MIDSEQVPWGKGEKYPGEGDEIVSETIRLQAAGAGLPVTVCLLKNEPTSCFYIVYLSPLEDEGVVKASVNSAFYDYMEQTRSRVTYPWPGWTFEKSKGRTEPTRRATRADELWIAEKFQSNSAIAGSPRNSFRASLYMASRGRALNGDGLLRHTISNQTPNTGNVICTESDCGV